MILWTRGPSATAAHHLHVQKLFLRGIVSVSRAGYDLRESVAFRMMGASQGAKPPELMSTHPTPDAD